MTGKMHPQVRQPIAHKAYYLLQEIIFATDFLSNHRTVLKHKNVENFPCPEVVLEKGKCILTYII